MNKKIIILAYSLTVILGFMSLYFLAYPLEPMRTQSVYALLSEFFFLIGFGFIIGSQLILKSLPESDAIEIDAEVIEQEGQPEEEEKE